MPGHGKLGSPVIALAAQRCSLCALLGDEAERGGCRGRGGVAPLLPSVAVADLAAANVTAAVATAALLAHLIAADERRKVAGPLVALLAQRGDLGSERRGIGAPLLLPPHLFLQPAHLFPDLARALRLIPCRAQLPLELTDGARRLAAACSRGATVGIVLRLAEDGKLPTHVVDITPAAAAVAAAAAPPSPGAPRRGSHIGQALRELCNLLLRHLQLRGE